MKREKCSYCDNPARRTAGGKPICGNHLHYAKAVREYLYRKREASTAPADQTQR